MRLPLSIRTPLRNIRLKALLRGFGFGIWTLASFAQPLPFDDTPVQHAIQDADGWVWSIHRTTGLSRWNGRQWRSEDVPLPGLETPENGRRPGEPRARPVLLQTNQQGTAHMVWAQHGGSEVEEWQFWITQLHTGKPPRSIGFRAQLAAGFAVFGSDGVGWLTEAGPRIYRIGRDLNVELAHTIPSNHMAGTRFDQFNPVQGVPLGDGEVLFWGEQRFQELATLRGLLLASVANAPTRASIQGLPENGFSCLTTVSPGFLWASVTRPDPATGLYEIDITTRRATRLAEPAPHAFRYVAGIHALGPDRYVVASDSSQRTTLWRWRTGSWEKLFAPLDSAPFDDTYRIARPFLSRPEGLWIGTGGNGILLVPASGDPTARTFDWRQGQPLESVHRIASLDGGEMLLIGFGHGTTRLRPDDLLAARTISPRLVDVWKDAGNLQVDAQRRLWCLRDHGAPPGDDRNATLAAWDGVAWTHHPLPPQLRQKELGFAIGLDTFGQLWVPYRERVWLAKEEELRLTMKVWIFAPTTSNWRHFDSLESAFAEVATAKGRGRVNLPGQYQPAFGPGNRVCFMGDDPWGRKREVRFFDGSQWQRWDLASIGFVQPGYAGQPFFVPDGQLAINFSALHKGPKTLQFDGNRWAEVPFQSAGPRDPADLRPWPSRYSNLPRSPNTLAANHWKTAQQQLHRWESGISIPQFRMNDVHPFIGARRVEEVWMDARGNMVLRTILPAGNLSGPPYYVVLAPPAPDAASRMEMVKVATGQVELQLAAIPTLSPSAPPGFSAVEIQEGQLILHWPSDAILETADHVEGPWTPIPQAASPHAVTTGKPSGFYRVRLR